MFRAIKTIILVMIILSIVRGPSANAMTYTEFLEGITQETYYVTLVGSSTTSGTVVNHLNDGVHNYVIEWHMDDVYGDSASYCVYTESDGEHIFEGTLTMEDDVEGTINQLLMGLYLTIEG